MEDLEIKKLIFSRMVTDLIIYDNSFAKFVLQSLKQYVKNDWDYKNDLFISYDDEVNDFMIWIVTEVGDKNIITILLPEEY